MLKPIVKHEQQTIKNEGEAIINFYSKHKMSMGRGHFMERKWQPVFLSPLQSADAYESTKTKEKISIQSNLSVFLSYGQYERKNRTSRTVSVPKINSIECQVQRL